MKVRILISDLFPITSTLFGFKYVFCGYANCCKYICWIFILNFKFNLITLVGLNWISTFLYSINISHKKTYAEHDWWVDNFMKNLEILTILWVRDLMWMLLQLHSAVCPFSFVQTIELSTPKFFMHSNWAAPILLYLTLHL